MVHKCMPSSRIALQYLSIGLLSVLPLLLRQVAVFCRCDLGQCEAVNVVKDIHAFQSSIDRFDAGRWQRVATFKLLPRDRDVDPSQVRKSEENLP
jgi:hypothetical protein